MQNKRIYQTASAGMLESCDALVTVSPQNEGAGIEIELISSVVKQYGKHITALLKEVAAQEGFMDVKIKVEDKGAWDYTLKARLMTALARGGVNNEQ